MELLLHHLHNLGLKDVKPHCGEDLDPQQKFWKIMCQTAKGLIVTLFRARQKESVSCKDFGDKKEESCLCCAVTTLFSNSVIALKFQSVFFWFTKVDSKFTGGGIFK